MDAKIKVIQETGIFHKLSSIETNDFVSYCITDNLTVLAVCDGSSSALLRSTGARLAAETAVKYTIKNYSYDFFTPDSDFVQGLLDELCDRLKAEAAKYGGKVTAKDMSTTLFLLVTDEEKDCFAYVCCGTEALWVLDSDLQLRMVYGSPEENSLCSPERFIASGLRHGLDNIKRFYVLSDGLFRSVYKGSQIIEPYSKYMADINIPKLTSLMESNLFYDDATMVVLTF